MLYALLGLSIWYTLKPYERRQWRTILRALRGQIRIDCSPFDLVNHRDRWLDLAFPLIFVKNHAYNPLGTVFAIFA